MALSSFLKLGLGIKPVLDRHVPDDFLEVRPVYKTDADTRFDGQNVIYRVVFHFYKVLAVLTECCCSLQGSPAGTDSKPDENGGLNI